MKLVTKDGAIELPSTKKGASNFITDLFYNQGRVSDTDQVVDWDDMVKHMIASDAVGTPDIRPLLRSSLETILREPVEPLMIITGLFTRIMAPGMQTKMLMGAVGGVVADDVGEGEAYPEVMFNVGPGMQTAYVGKSGIACSFTYEALRYSSWDVMAMNLRLMGQALMRHKELKASNFLKNLGTELMNNVTPTTSLLGVTTGRGIDGAANGSLTADDLMKAYAHMAEEGFPPDILLVNPMTYMMFLQDPVLRTMALNHGGGMWFNRWSGNAGPLDPWSNGSMGGMGPSLGNRIVPGGSPSGESATGIAGREHGMNSEFSLPPYFPWPFMVMTSPFVPYDADNQLADVFLLSSGNVGAYIVDEEPTIIEWEDFSIDVVKAKIRERYGFQVMHEGQGVGVLKNVKVVRNYWDGGVSFQSATVNTEIAPDADLGL